MEVLRRRRDGAKTKLFQRRSKRPHTTIRTNDRARR